MSSASTSRALSFVGARSTTRYASPGSVGVTALPEPGLPTVEAPLRVLLVDDRSERREVMRVVVETGDSAGTVVAQAGSPAAAVAAAGRYDPDVVVLEIQMPVAAGLATIASLRAAHASLVIVVCTFHADPSTRRQALVAGADAYLSKPVSARELHTACRQRSASPARSRSCPQPTTS